MSRPVTPFALAVFFWLAQALTAAVFVTLFAPGTPLDGMWLFKPEAHAELLRLRPLSTIGFLVLAGAMGAAALGCFQRRTWGWRLALAIFAVNGLGDAARAFTGEWLEGGVGVSATAVILWWLSRAKVRALFR